MMKLLFEMKDESLLLYKKFKHVWDEQGKTIAEQGRTIKDIQKNLGYITQQINQRPEGGLPSDTVPIPKGKEQYLNVTLRSGKVFDGPSTTEMREPYRKHSRYENEEKVSHHSLKI